MKNLQVQINSKSNLKPYDYLEMHCYVDFYKGWWWCGGSLEGNLSTKDSLSPGCHKEKITI